MYARIICAIGLGSRERAEHLLRTSQGLLQPGGELTVAHVVERLQTMNGGPDQNAVSIIAEAEEKLASLCKRLSLPAFIDVRSGDAAQTLLAITEDRNAELIVMAAHPIDVIDRIFGSTVESIVRHASCSVLIDRVPKQHGTDKQHQR